MLAELCEFLFSLRNLSIANLGDALVVAFAQLGLLFDLELFNLLFEGANASDEVFFLLPLRLQRVGFLANLGKFFLDDSEALARVGVVFFLQRLLFDLELRSFAIELVDVSRQRVDLNAQPGRRLVDEVDCFVGKKAVGDVAVRKQRGGDDRRIFNAHAVVHFVFLFQAAQDRDGVFDSRLADEDGLESAFERCVFFDVLVIFVQRRGADGAQLPASERGFQHIRGVHRAFGGSGADERVEFVNEKNDLALRFFDFLEDGFESVFEFAAIFRAREHRSQIERDDALVLQGFGHIAGNDALRKSFDDRRLADAGLADEHGIIFRAARKHLDHAADFFIASDDGIELALAGLLGEVARIFLQSLELGFGILVSNFLRAADDCERFQDCVVGSAMGGKDLLCRRPA